MLAQLAGMAVTKMELSGELAERLNKLLAQEIMYGERAGAPPFVRDIQVFHKPDSYVLNNDLIKTGYLVELFHWVKALYPQPLQFAEINEYWDELALFRNSEMESEAEFNEFFADLFLEAEFYAEDEAHEAELAEREETIESLLDFFFPLMFGDEPKQEISMYCLVNDSNENTEFAPYVFVGKSCLMVVLRQWIL